MDSQHIRRLIQVYLNATTTRTGTYYTTINELSDQVPAMRPDTLLAAATSLISLGPVYANKILCEEDKAASLAAIISLLTFLPLAMSRWYPYAFPCGIEVPLKMEYFDGKLYTNGINENDKVLIVDDTLSTGGTLIALAESIKRAKAEVSDIRVVVEKLGNGGRQRIKDALGIDVKAVLGISIDHAGNISVREILGKPFEEYPH